MTTPHRGLPPPAAMTLPSPPQQSFAGSSSGGSGLGALPQPWQGSEESLRVWLQTKMEEERRRAEEERTRQEQLRIETRKLELDLLRVAVEMGIPPPLVPLIFMGPGSAQLATGEWMKDYVTANLAVIQQHPHPLGTGPSVQQNPPPQSPAQAGPPPSLRRESRQISQTQQQHAHMPPVQMPPNVQPVGPQPGSAPPVGYVSTYQLGPGRQGMQGVHPTSQPRPTTAQLPRINTSDVPMQVHPPGPGVPLQIHQMGPPSAPAPGPPTTQQQEPQAQSPVIFFHHWTPPSSGAGGGGSMHATSSPQRQLDSPFAHHPPPNPISGSEYIHSPKRRKTAATQAPQQQHQSIAPPPPPPPPPPGGQPLPLSPPMHHISPPVSQTPSRTRRGHSRHRSDSGGRGPGFEPYARPTTRQRRSVGESNLSEVITSTGPSGPPIPARTSSDNGGNGGLQYVQQQHRQESLPPPQHPRHQQGPPSRPFSAGSEFRRQQYPPPPPPPEGTAAGPGNGGG